MANIVSELTAISVAQNAVIKLFKVFEKWPWTILVFFGAHIWVASYAWSNYNRSVQMPWYSGVLFVGLWIAMLILLPYALQLILGAIVLIFGGGLLLAGHHAGGMNGLIIAAVILVAVTVIITLLIYMQFLIPGFLLGVISGGWAWKFFNSEMAGWVCGILVFMIVTGTILLIVKVIIPFALVAVWNYTSAGLAGTVTLLITGEYQFNSLIPDFSVYAYNPAILIRHWEVIGISLWKFIYQLFHMPVLLDWWCFFFSVGISILSFIPISDLEQQKEPAVTKTLGNIKQTLTGVKARDTKPAVIQHNDTCGNCGTTVKRYYNFCKHCGIHI